MKSFTVCVLLYGDYPELADRVLSPFVGDYRDIFDLRIGANQISERTVALLSEKKLESKIWHAPNIKKYPMMRRLFGMDHVNTERIETPYTMWFDDDSFIRGSYNVRGWFELISTTMKDVDILAGKYSTGISSSQKAWIKSQPWYNGKEPLTRVYFPVGGWWCGRTELLYKFNWPVPEILHRGGDVMMGELCRQHDLRFKDFHVGIAINADENGKESESPRRGYNSDPVGMDFKPKSGTPNKE